MADEMDPANNLPAGYVPAKVWTWDKANGGAFANITRPISGATHDKVLPVGEHPLQLYSLGTPNGVKVTIMLEELLAAGHAGAEYDAWLIDDHPGIAQTDLAQRMRMDRATTMAIVNRLEARAYLLRGKSPSDGRKQTLNLTDKGRKALLVAKDAIAAHERWLKSRFTDKEVETLIELLTRIHE